MRVSDYHKHLATKVAEHLAGRPVEIAWREPDDPRFHIGTAGRRGNVGVLEVDPWHDPQTVFDVLTHEIAHLVGPDFDTLPDELVDPPAAQQRRPLSRSVSAYARRAYDERERRIEARANRWRAWATDRARDNTLEAHLEALLEYPR